MFALDVSKDLNLKQLDSEDASELHNLIESCRNDLREWLNWIDILQTVEDVEAFIKRANAEASEYKSLQLGIWFRGELAGLISFETIDWMNQSAEIGTWLGKRFRGKGISTKTTQAFVDYAFQKLNLNRIEIRCGVGNLKSQAVPERLGFRKEGTLHEVEWLHDRYIDHIVYGMTRTDYQKGTGF
jgi:ribosomal-protein-serine acetyltransferase